MSDEEKKEFEHLKEKIEMNKLYGIDIYLNKEQVKIIENLIKEIEELKRENLEIRDWKYVIDNPIDLDKLKKLDLIKIKGKEYISVDKIKAKIKELEKLNEKSIGIGYWFAIYYLQSLLEKE